MPATARATAERIAHELLSALAELADPAPLRVVGADNRLACLIQVWDARTKMPTAAGERRPATSRAGCRADILSVVHAVGRALTFKEVVRGLKDAGKAHGPSTVAKALAELTRSGELVNPLDKKGYRLSTWPRRDSTPSLFS